MLNKRKQYAIKELVDHNKPYKLKIIYTKDIIFLGVDLWAKKLTKNLKAKGYFLGKYKDKKGYKQVLQPFENCIKTYGCTCGGKECK